MSDTLAGPAAAADVMRRLRALHLTRAQVTELAALLAPEQFTGERTTDAARAYLSTCLADPGVAPDAIYGAHEALALRAAYGTYRSEQTATATYEPFRVALTAAFEGR